MAGCCRARSVATGTAPSGPCAWIEQSGAHYIVYPIVTTDGLRIVTSPTGSSERIDLASLLATSKCVGPTARWLLGELPRITAAARKSPATFSRYSRCGLGLGELARLAHTVGK